MKILKWTFLSLFLLILAGYLFILTPWGQNWIGGLVTRQLSKALHTKVTVKHVDFSLFDRMHLQGLMIEDQHQDTLLYAGDVRVNITDWFFFRKTAVLKNVAMEDALIRFQRTDSVWNQQFLFDALGGSSGSGKGGGGIQFSLNKLSLKNTRFEKKDGWYGHDLIIDAGEMQLDANRLPFSGNVFVIDKMDVLSPVVQIHDYDGRKPRDTTNTASGPDGPPAREHWYMGKMNLLVNSLHIKNGVFINNKENGKIPDEGYFDGKHILFSDINLQLSKTQVTADTIFTSLDLQAKERSGLVVKNMKSHIKATPQGMYFTDLDIQTNRSRIGNTYSMEYNGLWDMNDFLRKVKINGDLKDTYVDSDDIAFFAPALRSWKKNISISGRMRGTVSEWSGRNLDVRAGNNTLLNGDITMTGLPDIDQTFIDFKANDFRTTYEDAVTYVPALRKVDKVNLPALGYLHFNGSFTGFIRDFVTFGTLQTALGTVRSDLNMKLPYKQDPVYSGNISTENFNIGGLLDQSDIGAISMTGNVKGRGMELKTLSTLLDASVRSVEYKKYAYRNIQIKGKWDKMLFEGVTSMRDENADLDLNGRIDFSKADPRFDLIANVTKTDLHALHLTKDTFNFKGNLNLNFTSSGFDNFLGTASVSEAELIHNGLRLPFDSLFMNSQAGSAGDQILTLRSNEVDATVSGHFNVTRFPDVALHLFSRYYPNLMQGEVKVPADQRFHFDVLTYNVEDYVHLLDPRLTGFNNSHFTGDVDLANDSFGAVAELQQFNFKKYQFDSLHITASGKNGQLNLEGQAGTIHLNDSLTLPASRFLINASQDSSHISIYSGANQTVDSANINALVLTYPNGVKIDVAPSSFTINGKLWSIDEGGEITLRSGSPVDGQLLLREGEQSIALKTVQSKTGDWNDFQIEFTKLNLGDISPLLMPHNRLEGLLSGTAVLENPADADALQVHANNLRTQYLRIDNDSLGEVQASAEYNNKTHALDIKGNTLNQTNFLGFDGKIFLGDKDLAKNSLISLRAREFQLNVLERFLGNLFSDIKGHLTGDITLAGDLQSPAVYGKGRLIGAGLKVNFTQCYYWINDTEIDLKPTEINLNGLVLTDSLTHNPVYLRGGIQHENFKNMFYDLYVSTRKPNSKPEIVRGRDINNKPILLLNTTLRDNKVFFGHVFGTGSLSLTGPQSDMFMKIDAIASANDSSKITLPATRSRESGLADFLVERKYGHEMTAKDLSSSDSKITYDVDVTANPAVNVKVVMDDLTGDEINGRGAGSLNIHSGTTDPTYLTGRFDILEGDYLFTFQSFFKKPFQIRRGSENYIEWNGDPYDAHIKFEAQYTAERVNFDQLATLKKVSNSGTSSARGDVYVVASLSNKLFNPDIRFSLDFPSTSVAVTDPELALIVKQIQNNANEINRQATYLIVFNSFAPSELAGSSLTQGININTISGILLNVINDQINKILSNLFKSDKYNISLNTSFYNSRTIIDPNNKTALNLGSNVNFSVGRSFFNNRFIITAGGGFDAPLQQQTFQQGNGIQFLKDVTMEWLMNASGSIRVSFFYKENADYLTSITSTGPGKAKRIGGNLSYRKDFDRLSDIFKKKNKKPAPVKVIPNTDAETPKE